MSMAASTSWWLMCCFTPFHTNKVPLSTLAYLLGCLGVTTVLASASTVTPGGAALWLMGAQVARWQ